MSFDVLHRNVNVFAPHFLEASAGTGKTFAIEHLVARLLIEGDSNFTIERILVVTFTKAAARELKERIRRNLFKVKEDLHQGTSSFDYVNAIFEKGGVKEAVEKIEAALVCYDCSQIFTLHSFCYHLLREFAFEADLSLEIADPDEKEHEALLEQWVKEYLKEGIQFPEYSSAQIKAVLKKFSSDPRKMISSLADQVLNAKEIPALPSYKDLFTAFGQVFQTLPKIDFELFKADMALLSPNYKGMTHEDFPAQIDQLGTILSTKECTSEDFDFFLAKEFFLEKMELGNQKVRAKLPQEQQLNYPGLIHSLRQTLLPILNTAKSTGHTLLRLVKDLRLSCQRLLEEKEKLSPDALLLKMEKALQDNRFVEKVRQKYAAAIVDEFQDTDPVQWNIFQQLFLKHLKAICLVGDPKQSIYAFRNADLYTYLAAADALGKSAKKYLDTNYRSNSSLVQALNLLFSQAEGRWIHLPSLNQSLEVSSVKAGIEKGEQESIAPLQFFLCVGKKGRAKKFPTSEMLETHFFPFIAHEVLKARQEKKVEYHEIAVLVKDRYQGAAIVAYLKKEGIPASFKRADALIDSPAYFAFKEILSAVLAPYDMSKMKAALGGPMIAWDISHLQEAGPDLLQAKASLQRLNQILLHEGIGPFFQALLKTSWKKECSLGEALVQQNELSFYLDLRKLVELLIEEEIQHRLKGEALLQFLEEISIEKNPEESRFRAASLEEKGSVTVMTIHMSKGLEFDTVFALGVASRHPVPEHISVKEGSRQVTKIYQAQDPNCLRALEEQDAEKMRQFYVALTRAKRRLYVPVAIDEEKKEVALGEAAPTELFFAKALAPKASHQELYAHLSSFSSHAITSFLQSLSPSIDYCILEESPIATATTRNPIFSQSGHPAEREAVDCILTSPPLWDVVIKKEPLLSFTALSKKEHLFESPKLSENAILSSHTLPLGSETGITFHYLMEKIFKYGVHHPLDEEALELLLDEIVPATSLEKHRGILLPWLLDLLKKPLAGFSLCDVPREKVYQEMEFFFPVPEGMMKGFADLFFEYEGKYYLLDWKSNYLGSADQDYSEENLHRAMLSNDYYLQASIYAAALQRYVKLFDNRPFVECFGGAFYYFVRGRAILHFIPEPYGPI